MDIVLGLLNDNKNIPVESFINDAKFNPYSIILYRKGENIHNNTFGNITSYYIVCPFFSEKTFQEKPFTVKEGFKMLLMYYAYNKKKVGYKRIILEDFLQTSIICLSDDSGKISQISVMKDQIYLSDIICSYKPPIKKSNNKAAIHQVFSKFQANSFSISTNNHPNCHILDKEFNSQVQNSLLKEREIKDSIKQTNEKMKQMEWDNKQKKIEDEHRQMLIRRLNNLSEPNK